MRSSRSVDMEQYKERLKGAMTKSIREAKVHSTWANPNTAYEDAAIAFLEGALDPGGSTRSWPPSSVQNGSRASRVSNSLVRTTLKLTAPGVPDIYQGAELWDLSLVDP